MEVFIQKAKQVVETYEKNIEEVMSQMESDVTDHSSPDSPHATLLPIQEKDDIFLKCTVTNAKGTPFGLGSLSEIITKGKRKATYPSSSPDSLLEIQEQLQVARRKLADQDEENARRAREDARRDEEQRDAQNRIATLEMLVSYLKTSDPGVAEFLSTQPPANAPLTTAAPATNITPATATNVNQPATTTSGASSPSTSPATAPTTSPLSVSSSHA
ncbi:PREDICTED: PH domain-containing protein DDB_G0287875-like [Camelina sativa]|nr:PREDICTED: PH domain-containing protein DDB_G0287875-like [Camelina sativa]